MRRTALACLIAGVVTGSTVVGSTGPAAPSPVAPQASSAPQTPAPPPRLNRASYERVVQDEAYWISAAQLDCTGDGEGAIAEARLRGTGPVSVHPYEANIAARALLAADPHYFSMVRAYLEWYRRHLNRPDQYGVAGTVYDYDYDPVGCTGAPQRHPITGEQPKYDSSDAYAGTFLTLVAEYARANPADHDYLRSPGMRADLELIADVVGATRGPSGLSGATPVHHAEYLMDNVEAHRGIADFAWLLASVLGDPVAAQRRNEEAARIREAIEARLWAAGQTPGMYGWAADRMNPSWRVWFPDSVAQLWPVLDGLGPEERRRALWAAFAGQWPAWPRSTPRYGSTSAEHDPAASAAYAAARIGDRAQAEEYLIASEERWVRPGRPPPWTVDDAGFRALAAATLLAAVGSP